MQAVALSGVSKRFRRHSVSTHFRTLKSVFAARRSEVVAPPIEALLDVSFEVAKGRSVALVGPNGAGKSTLLKLVAGIYPPDSGTVEVHGRVASMIELGIGFHPDFSGRENIHLAGMLYGLSRREVRARTPDIVAFAELGDRIDEPVRTYSSGMFMRLGFAVAIHSDPEILLVDEVLAVGDQRFALKCLERVRAFHEGGGTLIFVSHDLTLVREWCEAAVWLDRGRIVDSGRTDDVIAAYRATAQGATKT